jgi:hypothetical protein
MSKKANQEKIPAEFKYNGGRSKSHLDIVWKKPSEIFAGWSEEVYHLIQALDFYQGDLPLVDFRRLKDFAENVRSVASLSMSKEDPLAPYYIREGTVTINPKHLSGLTLLASNEYGEPEETSYLETMKKLYKFANAVSNINPVYARMSHLQRADRLCEMVRDLIEVDWDS